MAYASRVHGASTTKCSVHSNPPDVTFFANFSLTVPLDAEILLVTCMRGGKKEWVAREMRRYLSFLGRHPTDCSRRRLKLDAVFFSPFVIDKDVRGIITDLHDGTRRVGREIACHAPRYENT